MHDDSGSRRGFPPRLDPLRHLDEELRTLDERGLLREPSCPAGGLLNLCSNDYLGYASDPWPLGGEASGAGASRLVSGNLAAHEAAEAALASWLGAEAALVFSSGYAANVGVVSALARPGDVIVSDALNHASIIDGCRLSGATIRVVPHRDAEAVEAALGAASLASRRWVVTESYFSMDGDSPDLAALRLACDRHDAALIVDEAHALGVFGPRGTGLCAAAGVKPDVLVGTAGKSLGLQGAFAVGSRSLRAWLWNRARSFVFSTGISPALAGGLEARVGRLIADDAGRAGLAHAAQRLREELGALGVALPPNSRGPVIPWLVGAPGEAVQRSRDLRSLGVLVQAIRPPTVPPNTARLRITATARLSEQDLAVAARAFRSVARPQCST